MNIVIYDNEFPVLERILQETAASEIDAITVHNIGAIELAKELGWNFHISTQANISNTCSAKF